jgi:hypothetical protein
MSHRGRTAVALVAAAAVACGCGTSAHPGSTPASAASPPSLNTALLSPSGTWAVVVMGGSAASHSNFWQLFTRPTATTAWRLVTPPGVASNGGLVLASPGTGTVVAGFRPSQYLASSPLASTRNNGATWTPAILDGGLADVPDALAALGGGRLLALLTNGNVKLSAPGATAWMTLATHRTVAASAAAIRCRPGNLTAATFSPSGTPLVAANCTRPGTAGIFAYTHRAWHLAGPALPASDGRHDVTVLRLTTTSGTTTALLLAGTGSAAHLLAAWSTDSGASWSLSQPLPLSDAKVTTASFGHSGAVAVILAGNRARTTTATARSWQPLPTLPAGTATLAPGITGGWAALTVHGTRLIIWQLTPASRTWAATQAITVPIQFGSSG